jgi:uncharacterized protein (TIGR03437 family)
LVIHLTRLSILPDEMKFNPRGAAFPCLVALLVFFVPIASGLTIIPTFDDTIVNAPDSAAIQDCIKAAIAVYQPLFTDNVTVSILFRFATTSLSGTKVGLGSSSYIVFRTTYSGFIDALIADKVSANDALALAHLPPAPIAASVEFTTANGRALGFNTPGILDGAGGRTGSFDGIVTLSSTAPFQFSRAGGLAPSRYDAQAAVEHEINEVLGLGSVLDPGTANRSKPEDLFRYSMDSGMAELTLNADVTATSYLSIDGGVTSLAAFNQNPGGDRGDWLSPPCPVQAMQPLVQYAFTCAGNIAEMGQLSPEAIALDAIGYDLAVPVSIPPTILTNGVVPVFSTIPTIQQGSWASIFGLNLAATTATWKGDFPTQLAGTTVTVDGKPAYLWFVSPQQINFQVPDDPTLGPVNVVVTTAAGSAASIVDLAAASPSFSLLDGTHVAAIIVRPDGTGTYGAGRGSYDIVGPEGSPLGFKTVPAQAGDTVVLFGVGFGPVTPAVAAGTIPPRAATTVTPVTVRINGASVVPDFAGMTGAGLYQINLTIPAGAGSGDVPLVATVDGVSTQSTAILSVKTQAKAF